MSEAKKGQLKRELGILDVTMNTLSISVGSGIFLLPALVYVILGHGSILAYVFCGLIFLALGLCFGELSSRIPETGGLYVYIERAFGRMAGFVATFLYVFGVGVLACAALLNAMADIASNYFEVLNDPWPRFLFFGLMLSIISLLSIKGIKDSMIFIKTLTGIKVIAILALVVFGISQVEISNISWQGFPEFSKVGEASLLLIFAFLGGEMALITGGEMKNPKRTAPLGFLIGIIGAILIFCMIHLVVQGVLGDALLEKQDAPLADLAKNIAGNSGFTMILIVSFIAVWSTFSAVFMLKNRVLFAAAKNQIIPKFFAFLHPKFGTPIIAILFLAILEWVVASSGSFRYFLILVTASSLIIYFGAVLAFLKFRMSDKSDQSPVFKIPGGFLIAVFALIALAWIFFQLSQPELIAVGAFVAFLIILYYILNYFKTRKKEVI